MILNKNCNPNYITVFIFNMQYILNIAKKFEITPRKSSKSIQIITLNYFTVFAILCLHCIFNDVFMINFQLNHQIRYWWCSGNTIVSQYKQKARIQIRLDASRAVTKL